MLQFCEEAACVYSDMLFCVFCVRAAIGNMWPPALLGVANNVDAEAAGVHLSESCVL